MVFCWRNSKIFCFCGCLRKHIVSKDYCWVIIYIVLWSAGCQSSGNNLFYIAGKLLYLNAVFYVEARIWPWC